MSDWRAFAEWCAPRDLAATPATVAAFLASDLHQCYPSEVGQRPTVSSDRSRSRRRGGDRRRPTAPRNTPQPCHSGAVTTVLSGVRRQLGTAPMRRAAPLDLDPLARLLEPIERDTVAGRRDRSLLLLGFAAALRRSELVALDVEDLAFDMRRGLLVAIRASKTDQEQAGTQVGQD